MEKIKIEEYNKNVLENVNEHLNFSNWEKEPVNKEFQFTDFEDIQVKLDTLLNAIEMIGFHSLSNSASEIGAICGGLAQIAKQYLPVDELNFLDNLLLKKNISSSDKIELRKIKDIK